MRMLMVYGGSIKALGSGEWWVAEALGRESAGLLSHCGWPALGPGLGELGRRPEVVTVSRASSWPRLLCHRPGAGSEPLLACRGRMGRKCLRDVSKVMFLLFITDKSNRLSFLPRMWVFSSSYLISLQRKRSKVKVCYLRPGQCLACCFSESVY